MERIASYGLICCLLLAAGCSLREAGRPLPHLEHRGCATQLVVDGRPYIILGGELWNSAASSPAYMEGVWEHLAEAGLNTVLTPVYWELIEPRQGEFDFMTLDAAVQAARRNDLHLVLLWFGSWKNSMSCYAPEWVKEQFGRKYPLARTADGRTLEILSAFSETNAETDAAAFAALMRHLRETDPVRTVIMVQVENEIGMIGSPRDCSDAADAAYAAPVPQEVVDYLVARGEACRPQLYDRWCAMGAPMAGNWEEMFGPGPETEEIFMAYHYAKYVERVASAGRAEYDLPMYVNAALNSRGRKAGEYPSAGPLSHLWDLWHLAAPSIDLLSPDIYDPLYPEWVAQYALPENPLFIPEILYEPAPDNGARVFYALGEHRAIGFSPYAVNDAPAETGGYALAQAYRILRDMMPLLAERQAAGAVRGVWFDRDHHETVVTMNGIDFVCRHDLTLGWSPEAKDRAKWSETAAMILDMGDDEYLVAGTGVVVTMRPHDDDGTIVGIARIDEVISFGGADTPDAKANLRFGRRLNGDEDHQGRHLRIPFGSYGAQLLKCYTYR